MSSYFVNLLRLCGEEIESVCNSVNVCLPFSLERFTKT